jgi:hypothetical protein
MNCLPSLERLYLGSESHSRHSCLYYVRLFCVCVLLCVGRCLATGLSPFQGVLPTVYKIKKLKAANPTNDYTAVILLLLLLLLLIIIIIPIIIITIMIIIIIIIIIHTVRLFGTKQA